MIRIIRSLSYLLMAGIAATLLTSCVTAPTDGFVSLFDGKTLKGWSLYGKKGEGYYVKDGMIVCARGGGGNLLTDREFSDFVLRVEFRLEPGSNNGIGIRAPLTDKAIAYQGMEIQVIDDYSDKYGKLKPWQFNGSIYNLVPAKVGSLKPAGEWNYQEITCVGRRVKVKLNGHVIVDANLNDITDAETIQKHPGMLRDRGHIGFLGHNDYVEFRNIRIKELPRARVDNLVPEGFTRLFNGQDLAGWQGLQDRPYDNPAMRSALPIEKWADQQVKADDRMQQNWKIRDRALIYVGKGFDNLVTTRDYGNFELLVDWKIPENADSGIYLRGTPQVQIWDKPEGSGGLYNNKKNASKPLKRVDYFVGEWNRFRIVMLGDRAMVFLNEELVVYDGKRGVVLENYWTPGQPLFPRGPIELQAHKDPVQFKNIFIRELP